MLRVLWVGAFAWCFLWAAETAVSVDDFGGVGGVDELLHATSVRNDVELNKLRVGGALWRRPRSKLLQRRSRALPYDPAKFCDAQCDCVTPNVADCSDWQTTVVRVDLSRSTLRVLYLGARIESVDCRLLPPTLEQLYLNEHSPFCRLAKEPTPCIPLDVRCGSTPYEPVTVAAPTSTLKPDSGSDDADVDDEDRVWVWFSVGIGGACVLAVALVFGFPTLRARMFGRPNVVAAADRRADRAHDRQRRREHVGRRRQQRADARLLHGRTWRVCTWLVELLCALPDLIAACLRTGPLDGRRRDGGADVARVEAEAGVEARAARRAAFVVYDPADDADLLQLEPLPFQPPRRQSQRLRERREKEEATRAAADGVVFAEQ